MIQLIEFRAMGSHVSVQLEAYPTCATILNSLPDRFASIEASLTRFNPHSELMRLNAQAGDWIAVSNLLFTNIRTARHAASLTDGLYNPLVLLALMSHGYDRSFEQIGTPDDVATERPAHDWHEIEIRPKTQEVRIPVGSAIDLGGIVKGWTATTIANDLEKYGPCLVDIGGDMVARGSPEGFTGWPVEIEDPFTGDPFTAICLTNSSIVTSGTDYRRWQDTNGNTHHHIIDPRTGQAAATDILTATVTHPSATTAEAYAKALILRGADDGLAWLTQQWHGAGLVFRQDGAVIATSTFTN